MMSLRVLADRCRVMGLSFVDCFGDIINAFCSTHFGHLDAASAFLPDDLQEVFAWRRRHMAVYLLTPEGPVEGVASAGVFMGDSNASDEFCAAYLSFHRHVAKPNAQTQATFSYNMRNHGSTNGPEHQKLHRRRNPKNCS